MSFTTDPAVASRLADRNWRIIHSLWIATPIVCCGIFSCAGFIYAAGRVRNRKWNIIAAVSTVVTIAVCVCLFAFENAEDEVPDWAGGVMIASCIAHLLAGLALRNEYLVRLAQRQAQGPWYGYGTHGVGTHGVGTQGMGPQGLVPQPAPGPGQFAQPAYPPPQTPVQNLIGTPDYFTPGPPVTPRPTPASVVDINTVTAPELAAATGLDTVQSDAVIAARARTGGFRDFDDLAASTGLPPHHLARLRSVTFGPTQPDSGYRPPPPPGGRILDI